MRCPKCEERMVVTNTTHFGKLTVRYLRCPLCGKREQSIEVFRKPEGNHDATYSNEAPKDTV